MFLLRDSLPGGGPLQKQTLLCRSAVLLTGAFSLTEIRQNFCKIKKTDNPGDRLSAQLFCLLSQRSQIQAKRHSKPTGPQKRLKRAGCNEAVRRISTTK